MYQRGQPTSFQQRLEIKQRAESGQNDPFIAKALGCSVWTVRKWRRIAQNSLDQTSTLNLAVLLKAP